MPKLSAAIVLLVLVAVAANISYTGFLVIGVVAGWLGTGRFIAGLLLGILFARFPSARNGKLQLRGLLPKAARRPLMLVMLGLGLARSTLDGALVPALSIFLTAAFLITFPLLKKAALARVSSSFMQFDAGRHGGRGAARLDDNVIEGEFKETKG